MPDSKLVAEIAEPLRPARVVARPQRFPPLKEFSCGVQGSRSEKLINGWAREVFRGQRRETGTVLVLEDGQRRLIGLSSFRRRYMHDREARSACDGGQAGVPRYVHVIAVNGRYRGRRLKDGSRIGDVLLTSTLEHIEGACGGRMPQVWTIVTPENTLAQALFLRHGFDMLGRVNEDELVYTREAGVPLALVGDNGRARGLLARILGKSR